MTPDDDVPSSAAPTSPTKPNTILAWSLRGVDELDLFPTDAARDRAIIDLGREAGWRHFALGLSAMTVVVVAVAFGGRIVVGSIWPGAPSIVRDDWLGPHGVRSRPHASTLQPPNLSL